MRLLSTKTFKLREFSQNRIPNYAILSHRWGEEEVTFQDLESQTFLDLKGHKKLVGCCKTAAEDGYDWVWIDTCCIDKKSSAELSEAINSMYSWYAKSSVCYAYLEDLESSSILAAMKSTSDLMILRSINDLEDLKSFNILKDLELISELEDSTSISCLENSKWFSRGWTLQELIAPRRVIFFNGRWKAFGSKQSLAGHISHITNIPLEILLGKSPLSTTIAERMSWASKRQTTREEDVAYCLMGLFDIHMPPIYGEGSEKAFLRLQEEILSHNSDQTLFIWSQKHEPYNLGLLATSPKAFCNEGECFEWIFQNNLQLARGSPYYSLRPITFSPATRSFNEEAILTGIDAEQPQASLGSSGLQVSLLRDNISLQNPDIKAIVICLDVVIDGGTSEHCVTLDLTYDFMYSGYIPNRLGKLRRRALQSNTSAYGLTQSGSSFTRTTMTISQLQISSCGPGTSARFMLRISTTVSLVDGITIIETDGTTKLLTSLTDSFECIGAVVALKHSCRLHKESDRFDIIFGTRPNSHPWCTFMANNQNAGMNSVYNHAEKHSARCSERAITHYQCGKQVLVSIVSNEDDKSHIVLVGDSE